MKLNRIIAFVLCILMILSVFSVLIYAFAAEGVDLTISAVTSTTATTYDGDKIFIVATVRNSGTTTANGATIGFYYDGKLLQYVTCREKIPSGGRVNIQTTMQKQVSFGMHKITATINESRTIVENSYANNTLKTRQTVIDDDNPNPSTVVPLPVEHEFVGDSVVPTIIEAETATLIGAAKVDKTNEGYKGTGYVSGLDTEGSGLRITYNAPESGSYSVKIRYCTVSENSRTLSFSQTDTSVYAPANFSGQKYSDSWVTYEHTSTFVKGNNTLITFFAKGNTGGISIDRFTIEKKPSKKVTGFYFLKKDNPKLDGDIECTIGNNDIMAYIPHDVSVTDLVASYVTASSSVTVQGVKQESGVTHNNFFNGHYYTFTDGTSSQTYAVYLNKLDDNVLPNVYVDLADGVTAAEKNTLLKGYTAKDKDVVVPCAVTVTTDEDTEMFSQKSGSTVVNLRDTEATIRLRGNSTLGAVKKPYKIKFSSKSAVLDMPKNKHWVLLANYDDKSYMRYYMGFELGKACTGLAYTPNYQYVNLFFDGRYNGMYLLGEQIKVDPNRVDVAELTKTSKDITGGYIVELDERKDDFPELMFSIMYRGRNYPFTIKTPDEEDITDEMREYIKGYITDFFNTLDDPTTHNYEQYIDVPSFVDWYIAMEILQVNDSSGYSSVYMHKKENGKLYMGPIWDFNPGAGNINYGNLSLDTAYSAFWNKGSIWWSRLFKDSKFENAVKVRWKELYATGFDNFLSKIDVLEEYLNVPVEDNFKQWDCLSIYVWPQKKILHSYSAEVDMYRQFMKKRIAWLNTQYGV